MHIGDSLPSRIAPPSKKRSPLYREGTYSLEGKLKPGWQVAFVGETRGAMDG